MNPRIHALSNGAPPDVVAHSAYRACSSAGRVSCLPALTTLVVLIFFGLVSVGATDLNRPGQLIRPQPGLCRSAFGFPYPVRTANRQFLDQNGHVYLLKTMSSWAMAQNCSDTEITQALEGLKALKFNAVTVSPFGVHMRERNYATFIRGGAGINFGHEKWWPFGVEGLFDGGPGWLEILREAPQLDAKRAWSILDQYVAEPSWTPDAGGFLREGAGSGDDRAAAGNSSRAGLIYFPTGRAAVVDTTRITRGRQVRLRWYDPTTGDYRHITSSEPKSTGRSLQSPSDRHADGFDDWVLVVEGR